MKTYPIKTYPARPRSKFRRRLFLGLLAVLAMYAAYAFYVGMAFTAGVETKDMDWNNDGTVSQDEMLQAWYAVTVKKTKQGNRECSAFAWRSGGESIRVDCRTTMNPAKAQ